MRLKHSLACFYAQNRYRNGNITLLASAHLLVGSGRKTVGSTALGITETSEGCMSALKTVFSLLKVKKKIDKKTNHGTPFNL